VPPTAPVGYAVYLKTESDSAAGANWYWYERVPLDSAVPHDSNGVVARARLVRVTRGRAHEGNEAVRGPKPSQHKESDQ